MGSMAHMVVAGNLARDVEMRTAGNTDVPVVDIIVMVNQKIYKGKDPTTQQNRYEEDTMTVSCSFWRDRAGPLASLQLKKGAFVILAGNPRIRTYPRNDGSPGAEIIMENPELTLGPKMGDGGGSNGYTRPPAQPASVPNRQTPRTAGTNVPSRPLPTGPMEAPGGDEDVPFPEDGGPADPPRAGKGVKDDW